jgi:hypothetical protein
VVLTSRPGEYQAALQDGDGLPYAAVVDLQPETALERRVLRHTGTVYQFRHAELQDRLAALHLHRSSNPAGLASADCIAIDIRSTA